MIDQIKPYLPYYPYLLGAVLGFSVLLLLVASYNLWRQRTAEMWRKRHDAGKLGGRLLLVGLTMFSVTSLVSVFSAVAIYSFDYVDEFFPPRNPYDVRGVALSYLPTTTPTPSPLPPTPLPPTATPTPDPLNTLGIATPSANRRPPVSATLQILAVSDRETDMGQGRSSHTFPLGTERIYFWVSYENMADGVPWAHLLYHNAVPIQGRALIWQYGGDGTQALHYTNPNGFSPGRYEVRLYLGEVPTYTYSFAVADHDP